MKSLLIVLSALLTFATAAAASVAPGRLLIYYGWPSGLNGTFEVNAAAAEMAPYQVVVLGDGLELASHPDHANTVAILAQLHATSTAQVYGYIDLGVSTQNLPLAEITARMDAWQATGADGIFLDDFGYDFLVTRARQNAAVAAAHARGLPVIANAWVPAHACGSEVDPVANPAGEAPLLGPGDSYLSESFQIALGAYQHPAAWWAKASALEAYKDQLGIGVLAVTTSAPGGAFDQAMFDYAWFSALLCGYDAVGWGEDQFAASTGQAPLRAVPGVDPGAAFASGVHVDGALYRRGTEAGWVTVDTGLHAGSFLAGPVGVAEAAGAEALTAAPNPFNPVTVFAFTLERTGTVTLEIFDVTGERVARPIAGAAYDAGRYEVRWNGAGLPSGPYFARLHIDGSSSIRRVTLVR